jgi:glycosyltransferase involved in cell wall biosynthesis
MRIAHVTATFPPYHGGAGTVCMNNAASLARLGHEVEVLTAGDVAAVEARDGYTVHRLVPLYRVGNAPLLPQLLWRLRGFDVVHLHYPFIFGAEMVWAISRLRRIPYVLTHHNDLIGRGVRGRLFDLYSAVITPLVFRGASKLLVVSEAHARHCRQSRLLRRRWSDVVEIPNGVDIEAFRPNLGGSVVRERHAFPPDSRVLTFVGALDRAHYFKGVDYLLDVFGDLQTPNVILMIVGNGDLRSHYEAQAARLELADRVRFVGPKGHHELPLYYAASDVVVLPSSLESFGIVLIEAMACGKPVVAHDLPGIGAVVDDGENGLLVELGNALDLAAKLDLLLSNPEQCVRWGSRGREKAASKYAWQAIGHRLEAVYDDMRTRPRPTSFGQGAAEADL